VENQPASLIDRRFLDALASAEPTPGGGSASAVAGAIAAGLVSMVARLTLGPRYAAVRGDIEAILASSEELRGRLTSLAEQDMAAYTSFCRAQRLPRSDEVQRRQRTESMQEGLRACTTTPLQIAAACREVLQLCPALVSMGNPSAITDVGVACALAEASLRGAGLQVEANLAWIKDEGFIAEQRRRLAVVAEGTADLKERLLADVQAALSRSRVASG
jgi:methenyltetrahydrofolate cyclohydrolase